MNIPDRVSLTESGCLLKSRRGPFFFGVVRAGGVQEALVTAFGLKGRFVGPSKAYADGRS